MVLGTLLKRLLPYLFFLTAISPCHAENERESARELDAEHRRGVELAREGYYDAGLAVLTALLGKYPGFYPLERDIVIVTAWKGDWRATVSRSAGIRAYPYPEP